QGELPSILHINGDTYITTTVFVKYNYESPSEGNNRLRSITIAGLPNGLLQEKYNPSATDSIWLAGRNAPSRGEVFRVRLAFARLKAKAGWRVQHVDLDGSAFEWSE
ncbi:MAG: SfiI family type II restriction endonuclease, partial [Caldilineaceae bacterium]|nr:SfiI family type II restriction endonuclease [Caldilineaceae bacterium]